MAETYTDLEKRKYPRVDEETLIFYKTSQSSEVKTSSARDISGGGICFDAAEPLLRGDVLQLVITKVIDDAGTAITMPIQAKVIWARELGKGKYRTGLQFNKIDESHRAMIIENVEQKLKK